MRKLREDAGFEKLAASVFIWASEMHTAFWLFSFIALVLLLSWRPSRLRRSAYAFSAFLLAFSLLSPASLGLKSFFWLLWLAAFSAAYLPSFRRDYIIEPLMRQWQTRLAWNQDICQARDGAGWEAQLLFGKPDWAELTAIPHPELSPDEHAFLNQTVSELCTAVAHGENPSGDWQSEQPADISCSAQAQALTRWSRTPGALNASQLPSDLPASDSPLFAAMCSGLLEQLLQQITPQDCQSPESTKAAARISTAAYACRALSLYSAGICDLGENAQAGIAMSNHRALLLCQQALPDALRLSLPSQTYDILLALAAAAPIDPIHDIYQAGVQQGHAFLGKEAQQLAEQDSISFESTCAQHIGHWYSLGVRAWVHGLSGNRLASAPTTSAQHLYQQLARYSAGFALLSDFNLLSLGEASTERQAAQLQRLSQAWESLYTCSVALKQFAEDGENPVLLPVLEAVCQQSCVELESVFDELIRQLPWRVLAWKLRWLIFPLGRRARCVDTITQHVIVNQLDALKDVMQS